MIHNEITSEMLPYISEFALQIYLPEFGFSDSDYITIEIRKQINGETLWAVCWRNSCYSTATGEFEYESMPSSRTDEYKSQTRFDLPTAWKLANEAVEKKRNAIREEIKKRIELKNKRC